jgi:hypothetical protein
MRHHHLLAERPQVIVQGAISARCLVADGHRPAIALLQRLKIPRRFRPRTLDRPPLQTLASIIQHTTGRRFVMRIQSNEDHGKPPAKKVQRVSTLPENLTQEKFAHGIQDKSITPPIPAQRPAC